MMRGELLNEVISSLQSSRPSNPTLMVEGGQINPERLVTKTKNIPSNNSQTVKTEHKLKIRKIAHQIKQGFDVTKKEDPPKKRQNLPEKIYEALQQPNKDLEQVDYHSTPTLKTFQTLSLPSLKTLENMPMATLDEELMDKVRQDLDIKEYALATQNFERQEALK